MKALNLIVFITLMISILSCKKDLVDSSQNNLEDINSLTQFDAKISDGVSLIFFHASWCPICKAQRPAVEAVVEDTRFSGVYFGEVEYEDNSAITDKYKVEGFPTILIFKDNQLRFSLEGGGNSQQKIEDLLLQLL